MPRLTVDLSRIEDNARLVAEMLRPRGIRLVGVTKACLGDPRVGAAMLAGGAAALADSRVLNLARLRRGLPGAELHLMRSPVDGDDDSLRAAGLFFVSSAAQAERLLDLAPSGTPVELCLMLDTGDGREGVPRGLVAGEAARVAALKGARFSGLATNAACARPQAPLETALDVFTAAVAEVVGEFQEQSPGDPVDKHSGPGLPVVSAGGSGLLRLLAGSDDSGEDCPDTEGSEAGPWRHPAFDMMTDFRCGEAILLGRIPGGSPERFLPQAHRDAFVLEAPILEVFDKGGGVQALVGFGVQDVGHGPLTPLDPGVSPAILTSDYLVVSCSGAAGECAPFRPGSRLRFVPGYYALLAAMTSPYVEKEYISENRDFAPAIEPRGNDHSFPPDNPRE
ncbi:MAG: alanine racemase [Thermoleophilia bacterium]|nr:alanine racemase [Thermoleophilia bacterium]